MSEDYWPLSEQPPEFKPGERVRVEVADSEYDGRIGEVFGVSTSVTRLGWAQNLMVEFGMLDVIIVPSYAVTKVDPEKRPGAMIL